MNFRMVFVWLFIGAFAAFGLYMVKFKVQTLKVQVAAAEMQLREEKKNLHVLNAEWTYLNRPERLRQLSAHYLSIKPVQGQQVSDYASLPNAGAQAIQPAAVTVPAKRTVKGITLASGTFHGR